MTFTVASTIAGLVIAVVGLFLSGLLPKTVRLFARRRSAIDSVLFVAAAGSLAAFFAPMGQPWWPDPTIGYFVVVLCLLYFGLAVIGWPNPPPAYEENGGEADALRPIIDSIIRHSPEAREHIASIDLSTIVNCDQCPHRRNLAMALAHVKADAEISKCQTTPSEMPNEPTSPTQRAE